MKKYSVSLYLIDDPVEDRSDRVSIPLTRLFAGLVEASDDRYAAARAWIDNVGTHRWEKLDRLDAPDVVRRWQVDPDAVVGQLVTTRNWLDDGTTYLLDIVAEAWLISVQESQGDGD